MLTPARFSTQKSLTTPVFYLTIVLEQPRGVAVRKQRQGNNLPRGPKLYLFLSSLLFSLIQSSNRREVIYIPLMPPKNFDFKQFPMSCARVNS